MLLIPCPWCGARAQTEYSYGGDATVERPPNPEQVSREEWRRDTLTHEVLGSAPPGEDVEGDSR